MELRGRGWSEIHVRSLTYRWLHADKERTQQVHSGERQRFRSRC